MAQANWGNLWPLCHFPLPPFGSALLLQGCLAFSPWFVYCQRTQRGHGNIDCKSNYALFRSPFMRHQSCDAYAVHTPTHTHTHERAIKSTFIRANLIYCLQLAGQKDTALKAFQCNKNQTKKVSNSNDSFNCCKKYFFVFKTYLKLWKMNAKLRF